MNTESTECTKDFLLFRKKSKAKEQFYNNNFRKFVIFNLIPDALAIYIPINAKDLTVHFTMLVFENQQNALKFAHLVETRLSH